MNKDIKTIIEINHSGIKILQARVPRDLPVLSLVLVKEIKGLSGEPFVKAMVQVISSLAVKIAEPIVLIPRRDVLLKRISFPSHDEGDIRKMVELQIPHQVPYAPDEIVFDYLVLDKTDSGYAHALVAVVQKDKIRQIWEGLHKLGIRPETFAVSSWGIMEWFNRISPEEPDPLLLIDIDEENAELCFCHQQKLLFSRSVNFGAGDLNPQNIAAFTEQVGLTIGVYRKEAMGGDIKKIFIFSRSPEVAFLKEKLQEYYQWPVLLLTGYGDLPCEKEADLSALTEHRAVSLTAGLGFLLAPPRKQIDLTPVEYKDTKRARKRKKEFFKFLLSLSLLVLLSVGVLGWGAYKKIAYLQRIEQKIAQLRLSGEDAEKKMQYLGFVEEQLSGRVSVADLVRELYALTPGEVSFRSLDFGSDRALSIEGFSETGTAVSQLQRQLIGSKILKDVTLQYATKRKRFNEEYTEFRISCRVVSGSNVKK